MDTPDEFERHEIMELSDLDTAVFVQALLNSPEPGPRLRKAASDYKEVKED